MGRIKINDLSEDHKISKEDLKRVWGGTAFQNFDQMGNQMYNLLSSVMKSMNEMRMGIIRNMLLFFLFVTVSLLLQECLNTILA